MEFLFFFCLILPTIYLAGVFILVRLDHFLENRRAQSYIMQTQKELSHYIYQMGGKDVVAIFDEEPEFSGYRQYIVSYKDTYGIKRSTKCRVHGSTRSRSFGFGRLYLPIIPKRELALVCKEVLSTSTSLTLSSKEQIISDLTAENERLQAELEQLRQASERE